MKTKRLINCLDLLIGDWAGDYGCKDVEFTRENGLALWKVELKGFTAQFVYTVSESESCPVSTLFCRFYYDEDCSFAYDVYDMINYLDIYDYHCYYFSYIESRKRLEACFKYITDFIDYHYEEISALSQRADECRERKLKELNRLFSVDVESAEKESESKKSSEESLNAVTQKQIIQKYTTNKAYLAYLEGDFETALELYKEDEEHTEFEEKLIEFISERYAPYQAIPDECASVVDVQEYKNDKKESIIELRNFGISILISVVICSIPFFIAQLLLNAHYTQQSIVSDKPSPLLAVLYGLLPGIFAALVFREKVELLLKRNKTKAIDFYRILNPRSNNKVFIVLLLLFTLMSVIIFSSSATKPSIVVYEDRFFYDDGDSFHSEFEQCLKSDIWKIYYTEKQYNEKGKLVKKPSYVIKTINKDYIYLSWFNLTDEEEATMLYYMSEYRGKDIVHVETPDEM